MISEHQQAVLDLLSTLPMTLYDGQVPDPPEFPYAVLYMDSGIEVAERLCATSNRADFRFQVTSVGLTRESGAIVADAARSLLIDRRPVVAGRSCTQIRHQTSIPVRPDNDVTLPASNLHPMFAVDTYHFVSYTD